MSVTSDIAIIGAGAAGLMAAIFAGRDAPPGTRVVALDGAKKLGAKILVAGGGRCNVTHDVVHADDYAGAPRNPIKKVLRSFSVDETVGFFAELGVTLKREETGKLFPTTDKAQTVLDALLDAVADAGIELLTDHRVTDVRHTDAGFELTTPHGPLLTRQLILATGGKSLPKTGSDGGGYRLAQTLGHTVTETWPALVPLVLPDKHWLTALSGIALDVELRLASGSGKLIHRQPGAMLCTHFGLSGPAVMDISRHWIAARRTDPAATLSAHLVPDLDFAGVEAVLVRAAQEQPKTTLVSVLRRWLPERFAHALLRDAADVEPATSMAQLRKEDRRRVVHALTALPLPVVRDRGYLFAEVTAGGVPLAEVDLATMASRRCDGLSLCGEVLNVDGRIGGYNFQWAWCTGRLAGLGAAQRATAAALG